MVICPLLEPLRIAVSDMEAIILGLGSGMGETIHAVTIDGQEHLQYSGYHLRKISTQ